jgi:DNA-binding transcriptional regulator YdaS (Cro superfamily)
LARALKITPAAINQWKIIPADKLVAISNETGIPRHELRPDLYEGMRVEVSVQESAA